MKEVRRQHRTVGNQASLMTMTVSRIRMLGSGGAAPRAMFLVAGEMDCWTAAAKTDGQAESQVSCPREIHNPLSHFQTLISSQTQNLLTEVKVRPLVKTAMPGQCCLHSSRKGSTQFTQVNVLAIKMGKLFLKKYN